ncbi:MAG: hypothetical protein K2N30_05520 [Clostridia bacterium]|nr:hypothetical protein [Clostridia bacterium]
MKEFTVEISIDEFGGLEAETFGFKGKVCESELRNLLQDEFVIEDVDKKDDYYKSAEEEVIAVDKLRSTKK